MNSIHLAQKLIQFPSVTPEHAGVLDFIQSYLENLGFFCTRLPYGAVDNLYAKFGHQSPHFCFAGHVDVVPVGDLKDWTYPPFAGHIDADILYGRGAVDMKGAIAAFMSAIPSIIQHPHFSGSVSFLLTSDEEGDAIDGTRRVLDYLRQHHEKIDVCLVGEPTNPEIVGQMIKVGRRGSVSFCVSEKGKSGHVAYPDQADNPIPRMLKFLEKIQFRILDEGDILFDPSSLQITSIDVGNLAGNVIPASISVRGNIRFNPHHTGGQLISWLEENALQTLCHYDMKCRVGGEPFYGQHLEIQAMLAQAITTVTGFSPILSTSGGTSDARFIKDFCPVIEFGLVNQTAHHADECISVHELKTLEKIYAHVLGGYFNLSK